jgi:AraC-like DNA-binding protein
MVRAAVGADTRVPFQWLLPVMLAFTASCALAADWRRSRRSAIVPGAWIVVFFVILNSAQIVRMLFGRAPLIPALIPAVVTAGIAALAALIAWRAVDRSQSEPAPRYAKSTMDDGTAEALLVRIDQALLTDRLFARPGLTLSELAAKAGSTPHQVSEVLNRYGGVSFHERLKRCRVADVKAQLLDPSNDGFTIEGIGESAGFGSRSALYSAFRQIEGVTPKELRDRR